MQNALEIPIFPHPLETPLMYVCKELIVKTNMFIYQRKLYVLIGKNFRSDKKCRIFIKYVVLDEMHNIAALTSVP